MTDAARAAGPAPDKVSGWANGGKAEQIAADLARKINGGILHRYQELPPNSQLAAQWDVSERTISAAKKLLGDHGILKLENRSYYIA